MLIYRVINLNLLTTIKYMNALINMSSYQVSQYILCVILNFLIIMHYIIVIYENNYIHIFVITRYHFKCDWCWTDWATYIKGSNVLMRNINVMTIDYVFFFFLNKLFSIHALFIYLFLISQYMHLYYMSLHCNIGKFEQRKWNKAYTLGISCKRSWGELLYWKSRPFYHNCYMFDCQDF